MMRKSVVLAVVLSLYLKSILSCPVLQLGTVTVNTRGKVIFHTYTSKEETGIEVDTHIIELPTKLVIYDSQFLLPNAKEVLLYAFNLKKPIERLIVSHSHPDHYFGIDVFDTFTKIYALPETIEEIKAKAAKSISVNTVFFPPGSIPDHPTIPDFVAAPGEEFIDGVLFQFQKIVNSESSSALIVKMPFQRVILTGDFVFNRVHLFLAEKNMDNWITTLKALQAEVSSFYDLILVGHARPAPVTALQENIDYLYGVKLVYSKSANFATFKSEMVRLFPLFQEPDLLDYAKKPLYPNEP